MGYSKLLLVGGMVSAFMAGAVFQGRSTSQAFNVPDPEPAKTVSAPVRQRTQPRYVVQPQVAPVVQRQAVYEESQPTVQRKRSWEREVLIVAGSSGAGAAIGAVAGGKKGAAIGAISGGVAGLIYDVATRNK